MTPHSDTTRLVLVKGKVRGKKKQKAYTSLLNALPKLPHSSFTLAELHSYTRTPLEDWREVLRLLTIAGRIKLEREALLAKRRATPQPGRDSYAPSVAKTAKQWTGQNRRIYD